MTYTSTCRSCGALVPADAVHHCAALTATCAMCGSLRPLGSPCDCTAPEPMLGLTPCSICGGPRPPGRDCDACTRGHQPPTVAVDRAALERLREARNRMVFTAPPGTALYSLVTAVDAVIGSRR